ncbi:MAG: helix-turn-helix transcriptional regulator [Clostridia bacterium]|nr:helix-turn-helix transcriptional regulator [Clostridia bacterium]
MLPDEIPLRIARLRTAKGVSARDMSLSIGQNTNYINHIENGKALPSMDAFLNICEYLGVTPSEFFDAGSRDPQRIRELTADLKRLDEQQFSIVAALVRSLLRS